MDRAVDEVDRGRPGFLFDGTTKAFSKEGMPSHESETPCLASDCDAASLSHTDADEIYAGTRIRVMVAEISRIS